MKVLDLFSGIGGFSLGLERAGMETIAFCEIDPAARRVLRKHWKDVPIYDDVTTVTGERLAADGLVSVDVICGGFPCQDISLAGKGAGLAGERSGLWYEFHRLIKEIKPRYAIIENVSALRSRGLDAVLSSLAEIGYDAEWHCISASAVGAPHQRDRIWIVAYPGREGFYERRRVVGAFEEMRQSGRVFGDGVQSGSGKEGEILADADYDGLHRAQNTKSDNTRDGRSSAGQNVTCEFARSSNVGANIQGSAREIVADACGEGLPGGERLRDYLEKAFRRRASSPRPVTERCPVSGGTVYSWHVEPDVGRVADGVPGRVDRLKQLGNAVVPQIPELIGRAIIMANSDEIFASPMIRSQT